MTTRSRVAQLRAGIPGLPTFRSEALHTPPRTATAAPPEHSDRGRARDGWTRVLAACLGLLAILFALSLLLDPRGTLGSDSAGKLATLRVMDQRGAFDVDVGYWAAHADPTGAFHPLYYTNRVDGQWVQVTTLPQLLLAYPLYRAAGARAVLLFPMLGALLTALAARALARRWSGDRGWVAFWAVGLATPVAIYALDVWEHSLGLGLMAWGSVFLLDVATGRGGWRAALAGGMLFGGAATMRTEALVPLAVAAAIACIAVLARERRVVPAVTRGAAIVAGSVLALIGEHVLERVVLGVDLRAGRASSTAGAAGTGVAERAKEALTTTVGINGFAPSTDWVLGGVIVACVAGGTWYLARRPARTLVGVALFACAALVYAVRFSDGLGYLPGVLTACPLAVAGITVAWSRRELRLAGLLAVATVPIVWVVQYSGNAKPQWGGRYVLLSGVLLATVAVVALGHRREALVAAIALSALVTGVGVAWLAERSHTVANGMETLVARHDQAVVSLDAHLLREGGAFYDPDRHWLTAPPDRLADAVRIVGDAGDTEVAVLAPAGVRLPQEVAGFTRGARGSLEVRPGDPVQLAQYRNSASP
ncbi:MAG TPA: hypothetical protein VH986_14085 [Acidimicrobiia bacterium]|jgi:hypothetical protein